MLANSCQRSRVAWLAAGAVFLTAPLVSCGDGEGDADGSVDTGSDWHDDGGSPFRPDAQADARAVSDPACRSPAMIACACQRDAVCCGAAWDYLCDAVAEAYSCGSCDPSAPSGPGDPGWFDPEYRPTSDGGDAGASACRDYRMDVQLTLPDLLVALDSSGSMRAPADRFGAATRAIEELSRGVSETTRMGLLTFPGDCSTIVEPFAQAACAIGASAVFGELNCQPGQVKVAPALKTTTAIATQLALTKAGGASPLAPSLRAAGAALAATDNTSENRLVLLITDGAPNCANGNVGPVGEGTREGQLQAISDAVSAIEELRKAGVRTYVIGYGAGGNASLGSSLDRMAAAGGTGATKHYPADDQATLQSTMLTLTQQAAECTLAITTPLISPAMLQIKLDGEPLRRDEKHGYKLSADRTQFTLQGDACNTFRSGKRHVLFVRAGCPIASVRPADAGVADSGVARDGGPLM